MDIVKAVSGMAICHKIKEIEVKKIIVFLVIVLSVVSTYAQENRFNPEGDQYENLSLQLKEQYVILLESQGKEPMKHIDEGFRLVSNALRSLEPNLISVENDGGQIVVRMHATKFSDVHPGCGHGFPEVYIHVMTCLPNDTVFPGPEVYIGEILISNVLDIIIYPPEGNPTKFRSIYDPEIPSAILTGIGSGCTTRFPIVTEDDKGNFHIYCEFLPYSYYEKNELSTPKVSVYEDNHDNTWTRVYKDLDYTFGLPLED